ncbi:tRNA (N(6)-L-threonylcarbamoyladenosine(37)-C(2))-methylthiotransferase [Cuniculiplasma sp. SKW3]|uniref:tRNA (N(6)-L-threonylcarbamoyladenosine(37)-C(2))- methylthiotransferase n=1 Tax=unclassified Cuniculiplasma TaxID=2619706 RepID=UPI003FD1AB52
MSRKIYVESYGCTLQKSETGLYTNSIMEEGDVIVKNPEDADLRIIGTCAVIKKTEDHMIRRIGELSDSGKTMVIGCLPPVTMGSLKEKNVDVISSGDFRDLYRGRLDNIEIRETSILDGIPINQGCTGSCNYCISRVARGKLLSRPVEKIVGQAEMQISRGIREIRISSLDTAAYGKDTGRRLPDLIRALTSIDEKFMLRVGMMEPKNTEEILENLIESYRSEKVFKFLHIPVQSGDDRILELMNREYNAETYFKIVRRFREEFHDALISTDIIAGYPGDDEESFERTCRLLEVSRPEIVNITRFSPRQYTKDFGKKTPPSNLIKRWSQEFTQIHHRIIEESYSSLIGKERDIIITEMGKNNTSVGRDRSYRPVVIPGIHEKYSWVRAEIVETGPTYLIGKITG